MKQVTLELSDDLARQVGSLMATEEVELIFQAILDRDDIWINDALVRRVLDTWRRETSDR
jgi:hypothetical protein